MIFLSFQVTKTKSISSASTLVIHYIKLLTNDCFRLRTSLFSEILFLILWQPAWGMFSPFPPWNIQRQQQVPGMCCGVTQLSLAFLSHCGDWKSKVICQGHVPSEIHREESFLLPDYVSGCGSPGFSLSVATTITLCPYCA